jgi:polysaccharide biosynthesis protein PslH
MKQRILIISPTPTHPTNAGNRSRIYVYSKFLIEQGLEVHFLYSDQEDSDIKAMEGYWGNRFHYVSYKAPLKREYNKFLKGINSNYIYYSHVDDHYNELLDHKIKDLQKEYAFTAVIVEYIFNSKSLLNFGKEILKVVDTHDVMTNRHKHFLKAGKPAVWYSTSRKEEKKGIDRADVVMAIQDREATFYRKLTKKRVVTIGHIVDVTKPSIKGKPAHRILFVGSNNPNNYHALTDFIHDYFPLLRKNFPDLELYIAGKICQVIDDNVGIVKIGEVENITEAYRYSDIVFNPLTIGTGLKIKMIEAIGYGKAVISTTIGAEGLETGAGSAYLIADTPESFTLQLGRLFDEPDCFSKIVANAFQFVKRYNLQPCSELTSLFVDWPFSKSY